MKRQCGSCTLCCTLLPVNELDKGAGQRCVHCRHGKGCTVYQQPAMPMSCQLWNCRWLVDDDHADLRRPDRSHLVVDIMPEIVLVRDDDTGATTEIDCMQVWIDPAYPEAHRDEGFRRYVDRMKMPALIRADSGDAPGWFIMPPSVTGEGWYEKKTGPAVKSFKGLARRLREAVRER